MYLRIVRLLAIAGVLASLIGCARIETAKPELEAEIGITADDLAHASGIRWWIVEIDEVPKNKILCLAFVDTQGVIQSNGVPAVLRPGDRVKIVISELSDTQMRYSMAFGKESLHSVIYNPFGGNNDLETWAKPGSRVKPGDFVFKRTQNRIVGVGRPLAENEVGIAVIFQDRPQHKLRSDYDPSTISRRNESSSEVPAWEFGHPPIREAPAGAREVSTEFVGGNEQTRQFLITARKRDYFYCGMKLDEDGNCVEIKIRPRWSVKDEELAELLDLPRIEKIVFNGETITDAGLQHLEQMPALKEVVIIGARLMTDEGLARLQAAKPHLEIELPYRELETIQVESE